MSGENPDVAEVALAEARNLLEKSVAHFADLCAPEGKGKVSVELMDQHQVPLYELAHMATEVSAAGQLLAQTQPPGQADPAAGPLARPLALLYTAETVQAVWQRLALREATFGLAPADVETQRQTPAVNDFLRQQLAPQSVSQLADLATRTVNANDDQLTAEQRALQDAFRRFAADKIAPLAQRIHREDLLLPDSFIEELAQLGCFGLSIPAGYGGFQDDDRPDHMAMVIVSDELSRASFGTAGSLITRPELLAKALLKGGTETQKQKWLPLIASGQRQVAVAVTEPDYGSDVAHLRTAARPVEGGWRLNGTKMWCTFAGRADVLMVLARTDPDLSKAHRGLSLFVVEKPPDYGYEFEHEADDGRLSGRAIATIGYRGMRSFEVVFEDTFVPADNLIGGEAGEGRGFYLQMHGFSGSRLQTAGRALGIMTAAFEAGLTYARQRQVFGRRLLDYPLTQYKLVRMAMRILAARQLTYHAARLMDEGGGAAEAAMAKLLTARYAEWISREAQQLHGGMGYAEEFPISRHFVDARVLAIFEGAEEVLALRVIARTLLQRAAGNG